MVCGACEQLADVDAFHVSLARLREIVDDRACDFARR